jgi:hypothetical protein
MVIHKKCDLMNIKEKLSRMDECMLLDLEKTIVSGNADGTSSDEQKELFKLISKIADEMQRGNNAQMFVQALGSAFSTYSASQ